MTSSNGTLRDLSLLSPLSQETLNQLEERAWAVEGKKNSPIYYADDGANLVYFLMDGRVRLYYSTSQDREITLEYLEPGDFFGELSLMVFKTRSETAETLEQSTLKVLPGDFFRETMNQDPDLFSRIFDYVSERRQKIHNRLKTLVYEDAHKKIIYVLLDLSENLLPDDSGDSKDIISITHEELAHMAGLARPTTTKIINKLADEKQIDSKNSQIEILEPLEMRKTINLVR